MRFRCKWDIFYIIFLLISGVVRLSLSGMTLTNNSVVAMTLIGTDGDALWCTTTYDPCCTSSHPVTQWHFPNGSEVPNEQDLPYRRTRGRFPGRVILSRNSESDITGIFRCDILAAEGVTRSLYVRIDDTATGESCKLSEWLVSLQWGI